MKEPDTTKPPGTTNRGTARKRVSLTAHRAEIEGWVSEGRDDDYIAEALGTSRASVQSFRSRNGLLRRGKHTPPTEASDQRAASVFEGVLEHGEEDGYGLWLDPSVAEDKAFQRGFGEVYDVRVSVEPDRIVLTPQAPAITDARNSGVSAERVADLQPGLTDFADAAAGSAPTSNREHGTVKWFGAEKGYGFIYRPSGGEVFFHHSEIVGGDRLETGAEVSYEVGSNQRGLLAHDVRPERQESVGDE